MYTFLADALVVLHLAIVLYVLVGQALILVGWPLGWRWIRNFWFRVSHLGIMFIVAVEGATGFICPLTTWENDLREAAGQTPAEGSFVGRLAHDILFIETPQETLNKIYVVFFGLVFLTLVACRPRRPGRAANAAAESAPQENAAERLPTADRR